MKKLSLKIIIPLIISVFLFSFSDIHSETFIPADNETDILSLSENERSENDVLKQMKKIIENDNLELYLKQDEDLYALVNKKNGFIWWSAPINAGCDEIATDSIKYSLKSSLYVSYHEKKDFISNNIKSAKNADISYIFDSNSLTAIYDFKSEGIEIPVCYSLGDDFLEVNISSDGISENDKNLIHEITVMSSFGAGSQNENGYFIIPDGCGAVINFNNGKINSNEYSSLVYGNDTTAVPEKISAVNSQINLPVYAIVKDNNALFAIAHDGDENVSINASVSGQSKSQYNRCFFSFIMRGSDSYYIGNEENPITVFQNDEITNKNISVRYYAINDNNLSYCTVAEKYRNYLIDELELMPKDCSESADLYIDIYGGTMKKKSFLGIPVYQESAFTTFSQAQELIENLNIQNVNISYDNWTDNFIQNKIDTSAIPADILGGEDDFNNLLECIKNSDSSLYPVFENITFSSGGGYYPFTDTAMRISGSFAKISGYDYAYGIKDKFRKNLSIISPCNLAEIYENIISSCKSADIGNVSLGKSLSVLYGDYGRKNISRGDMKDIVIDFLKNTGDISILAEYPNAYSLPYVDCITDIPLNSGQYDIFDYDIPFYQMVIHGIIPYSSTAINSSPNPDYELIKAVAYGSALKYDLIYADSYELKDTEADIFFYGKYNNINSDYEKAYDFINKVKQFTITDFIITDNSSETFFSDGSSIILNNDKIFFRQE